LNIFRVIIFKLSLFIVILKDNQVGSI
jgi:hypothetical protein